MFIQMDLKSAQSGPSYFFIKLKFLMCIKTFNLTLANFRGENKIKFVKQKLFDT